MLCTMAVLPQMTLDVGYLCCNEQCAHELVLTLRNFKDLPALKQQVHPPCKADCSMLHGWSFILINVVDVSPVTSGQTCSMQKRSSFVAWQRLDAASSQPNCCSTATTALKVPCWSTGSHRWKSMAMSCPFPDRRSLAVSSLKKPDSAATQRERLERLLCFLTQPFSSRWSASLRNFMPWSYRVDARHGIPRNALLTAACDYMLADCQLARV